MRATAVDADAYVALGAAVHRAARALAGPCSASAPPPTVELLWLARVMSRSPPAA